MTVQTGSMVAVEGTWEAGPQTIITNNGYAATATPNAIIQSCSWGYQHLLQVCDI